MFPQGQLTRMFSDQLLAAHEWSLLPRGDAGPGHAVCQGASGLASGLNWITAGVSGTRDEERQGQDSTMISQRLWDVSRPQGLAKEHLL